MDINEYRKLNFDEVKREKEKILLHFDEFCKKNNIRYSLAYGTLLGAIRHNGWIPWDDDIDVTLLREDYNKLMDLYNNQKEDRFKIVNNDIDNSVSTKIAYLYDEKTAMKPRNQEYFDDFNAIQIDIYPLDILPQNRFVEKIFISYTRLLCLLAVLSDLKPGNPSGSRSKKKIVASYLIYFFMKPFKTSKIIKKHHKVAAKYSYKYSNKKNSKVTMLSTYLEPLPKINYYDMCDITNVIFNGRYYPALRNYDKYLTSRYGNYMELPPENKRVAYTFLTEEYYIKKEFYDELREE